MKISLPSRHPIAKDLERISKRIRTAKRNIHQEDDGSIHIRHSLDVLETRHGNGAVTYEIHPGNADSDQAIRAYQDIRKDYPGVLDLLYRAATHRYTTVTVEIGNDYAEERFYCSQHDILNVLPRVLSFFRGGA